MRSSYIKNNYGELFRGLIRVNKPKRVIEFGCLDGYSTKWILKGLKENNIKYSFKVFDLFEDYQYKHPIYKLLVKKFPEVKFVKKDYYESKDLFRDNSIDFMHIDISNTAEAYDFFIKNLYSKLKNGGIAVLEGGSTERDNCNWMLKFKKKKINKYLSKIKNKYFFVIINPYPSVTIFIKK